MCGLTGFTGNQTDKNSIIKKMNDAIIHRGPDSEGYYTADGVAFGHRRLSIVDIESGAQPMKSKDEKIVVVFNGEIYNFKSIREELEAKGHVFQSSHSDTEVLIHGYKEWKEGIAERLRGMFAFAIWDTETQTLFCARDHFGIKPFHYYHTEEGNLLFGSEIKSLLKHPEFHKELNHELLPLFLVFQYTPTEDSFFKGVKKLLPAHHLTWKNGKTTIKRYWTPVIEDKTEVDFETLVDEIETGLKASIAAHEMSDVEIGSFLSSGIDSSYVAKVSDIKKTYTIGYQNPRYDESIYAKEFSKREGLDHQVYYIEADEYWDSLETVQYHMDEPLADASAVALYFLNREAAKDVKVCFSGEGADELFGGYNVYQGPFQAKGYRSLPRGLRRTIGSVAEKLPAVRGLNFLVRHAHDIEERYIGTTTMYRQSEVAAVLKDKNYARKANELTTKYFKEYPDLELSSQMQMLDIHLWLVGDILLKADKMSMASSLEVRVPFLDKEIFEIARKIPVKYKYDLDQTKIALRAVAKRSISAETAEKTKLGFPVPVRDWMREEQYASRIRTLFSSEAAEQFFDQAEIQKMLEEHVSGKKDNWRKIWGVYTFLIWHKVYFLDSEVA